MRATCDLTDLEPAITNSTIVRYRRPPIVEALVDIHVNFEGEAQIATEAAMAGEADQYSMRQPLIATSWRVSASATDVVPAAQSLIGFRHDDKEAGRVALVRINGFTFSQHQPYPTNGWADWTVEARRLWQKYANAFSGAIVTRIAVRYINRIVLLADARYEDHFLIGPRIPAELGDYKNFLLRTELNVGSGIGATVLLTHGELVPEDGESGRAFLLDLDISSLASDRIASSSVWERLDHLHSLVGPVFEGALSEHTKRIFR